MEDSTQAARASGLRYVTDADPGIRRLTRGKEFTYVGTNGRPVRNTKVLDRIRALVIPPAWKDVWICASARGHLQATGRDARGRKQFRYHPRWNKIRGESKYARVPQFAKCLTPMRQHIKKHLRLKGLPREKVLAAVVQLLELTQIRVGNEAYVQQNNSFGLTTLRDKHVKIQGSQVKFQFKGKSGVKHAIQLTDRKLSRIVRNCQELPGQELFQYVDELGKQHVVCSEDVNEYIRQISGANFTAKDFRTWAGTVYTIIELQQYQFFKSQKEAKYNLNKAIEAVSKRLGNTKTVCRNCYIHPTVINAHMDGQLLDILKGGQQTQSADMQPMERVIVRFLQHFRQL